MKAQLFEEALRNPSNIPWLLVAAVCVLLAYRLVSAVADWIWKSIAEQWRNRIWIKRSVIFIAQIIVIALIMGVYVHLSLRIRYQYAIPPELSTSFTTLQSVDGTVTVNRAAGRYVRVVLTNDTTIYYDRSSWPSDAIANVMCDISAGTNRVTFMGELIGTNYLSFEGPGSSYIYGRSMPGRPFVLFQDYSLP